MGERFTQSPQARDLVRAKRLRHALDRDAAPSFIPSGIPSTLAQPPSLSWFPGQAHSPRTKPPATNADDTLSVRSQYLEQLFESSPDALVVVDDSLRAQCVNQEFQRMFGYSASQAMGQPLDDLILPPDRAPESQWITQCLQRGEQITLETKRRRSDGT